MSPEFIDLSPRRGDMRSTVIEGLSLSPKQLPPWLFYDATGSELFEAICEQPEYYPTRTEISILEDNAEQIADELGSGCRIIELGSGSSRKIPLILRALHDVRGYLAIDISESALLDAGQRLQRLFPTLPITTVCADYIADDDLKLPADENGSRDFGFFPGSTLGNMTPAQAQHFLSQWSQRLAGGGMLIGIDLVKPTPVLNAAYNDRAGYNARFNLNMLTHINRELGADFKLDQFEHVAFFNEAESRIEMHLESTEEQIVHVGDRRFTFTAGERLHTESSYKYTVSRFQNLARSAGFTPGPVWTDPKALFSVHLLRC